MTQGQTSWTIDGSQSASQQTETVTPGALGDQFTTVWTMDDMVQTFITGLDNNAVSVIRRYKYTAAGAETSFSGADDNAQTLSYNPGTEFVYRNGILLLRGTDYIATTGTSITGLSGVDAGDVIEVVAITTSAVSAINLTDLSDINITKGAGVDGYSVTYDHTTQKFVLSDISGGGGGVTSLDGLSDVTISAPATGNVLRYNGANFVNYPDSNYATSAQGALANSAVQPGDNVSDLVNDSGFIADITAENLVDLADVNITKGAGVDGYYVQYDHATGRFILDPGSMGSGGLDNIVEDSTPQLGADLDLNTFAITGTGTLDFTINASGNIFTATNSAGVVEQYKNSLTPSFGNMWVVNESYWALNSIDVDTKMGQYFVKMETNTNGSEVADIELYRTDNAANTTLPVVYDATGTGQFRYFRTNHSIYAERFLSLVTGDDTTKYNLSGDNPGPAWIALNNFLDTPAAATVGRIRGRGNDSLKNITDYAQIQFMADTVTDGSEDGSIDFYTVISGTEAIRFTLAAGLFANGLADPGAGGINATALQVSGTSVSLSGHAHATTDITSGTFADARIAQSNVTQHQAALSITESQISDLGSYLTGITGEAVGDLSDVTITGITNGEVLVWNTSAFINRTLAEAGIAAASHTHATTDITSGTFADARIAQSNVTQHQAALSITESQISDLGTYQSSDPLLDDISALADPNADRLLFWDDSAGDIVWLTLGTNLSITGTTINASGGGGTTLAALTDTTITTPADNHFFVYNGSVWVNEDAATARGSIGAAASSHTHATSAITSGTFANARIAQSNVTQHQAALALATSQITSGTFADARIAASNVTQHQGSLALATSQITSGTFADARIAQSNVTQHQAALSITESQISDLGTYQVSDPLLDDIAALIDPDADRLLFWDDSAGDIVWLTLGTNLSITGTTLNASGGGSGISNVVEDTTPQLGGDLDVNGNDIVSTSNGNVNIAPNGTGKFTVDGNPIGFYLIDETTLSSDAQWSLTGLNAIASEILITFAIRPATDDTQLEITLGGDDDSEDTGTSYDWVGRRWFIDSSPSITQSLTGNDNDSHINVSHQLPGDPTYGNCGASNLTGAYIQGYIRITGLNSAMYHSVETYAAWRPTDNAGGLHPNYCFMFGTGQHFTNEVIGAIFLAMDSGNMNDGYIRAYVRPL